MIQIFLGFLLAVIPVTELRGSIPLILEYCFRNNIVYWPYVALAILLNMLTVLFVFFFLDYIHHYLLRLKWYKKLWKKWIHNHLREKIKKIDKKRGLAQYLALLLFVALPIPGTGVWTSSVIAWILGMNRKKSFITLAIGAAIAGLIILYVSLRVYSLIV